MPRLPALIVAPAHSGTTFVADLLRLHGVAATHETIYGRERIFWEKLEQENTPVVDVSWFGLKHLDSYRDEIPLVVHLIRDPVKTARSWMASPNLPHRYLDMLWWGRPDDHGGKWDEIAQCDEAVRATHSKITSYEPDLMIRVEEKEHLELLLFRFGVKADRLLGDEAIARAKRNVGPGGFDHLGPLDFPRCASMARQCGYAGYEVA